VDVLEILLKASLRVLGRREAEGLPHRYDVRGSVFAVSEGGDLSANLFAGRGKRLGNGRRICQLGLIEFEMQDASKVS
jgi:hypothetical protein